MITPILEKAIINGWAKFQIHNHSFSNFGRIIIPKGSTVIITHIQWYPFFNPLKIGREPTYKDFFKYNQYQLKIDGKKSTNFLIYNNSNELLNTSLNNGFDLDAPINEATLKRSWMYLQKNPIHLDTYFICEDYIKLTVTRNAFINKIISNYGALNTTTDELKPQKGLETVKVELNQTMDTPTYSQTYNMGSLQDASLTNATSPNSHIANYMQDIDETESIFSKPDNQDFPYSTTPLIQIGYVIINNNFFDRLQNQ